MKTRCTRSSTIALFIMVVVAIGTVASPQPRVIFYDDFETGTIDPAKWSEHPHVDPNPDTSMAADSSPFDGPSGRWAAQQRYRAVKSRPSTPHAHSNEEQ
jgi:hypothetical protein